MPVVHHFLHCEQAVLSITSSMDTIRPLFFRNSDESVRRDGREKTLLPWLGRFGREYLTSSTAVLCLWRFRATNVQL